MPITREMADEIRLQQMAIDARPIKKVAEAKARKKKKVSKSKHTQPRTHAHKNTHAHKITRARARIQMVFSHNKSPLFLSHEKVTNTTLHLQSGIFFVTRNALYIYISNFCS